MKHAACIGVLCVAVAGAGADEFFDDFEAGPSPLWSNERGQWEASGGRYYATAPNNFPPTLTALPFVVGDCDVEVDLRQVSDGGVWLHIDAGAQNGVLLVTGGDGQSGRGLYWHVMTNGGYSGAMERTGPLFNQGDDLLVRVSIRGNRYEAYLNGALTPATVLTIPAARTGFVGLYDFASPAQAYESFRVTGIVPACDPDVNCDGVPDQGDVACIILAVAGDMSCYCQADPDFNGDGVPDQGDVADLILVVAGAPCP